MVRVAVCRTSVAAPCIAIAATNTIPAASRIIDAVVATTPRVLTHMVRLIRLSAHDHRLVNRVPLRRRDVGVQLGAGRMLLVYGLRFVALLLHQMRSIQQRFVLRTSGSVNRGRNRRGRGGGRRNNSGNDNGASCSVAVTACCRESVSRPVRMNGRVAFIEFFIHNIDFRGRRFRPVAVWRRVARTACHITGCIVAG